MTNYDGQTWVLSMTILFFILKRKGFELNIIIKTILKKGPKRFQ